MANWPCEHTNHLLNMMNQRPQHDLRVGCESERFLLRGHQRGEALAAFFRLRVAALGEPGGEHLVAPLGEDGFGVELYGLDGKPLVPHAHDHPCLLYTSDAA